MSFGGFLDNSSGNGRIVGEDNIGYSSSNMPSGAISRPHIVTQSLAKSMFNSPGLSLALQTKMEGQGEVTRLGDNNYEGTSVVGGRIRMRDEENESRSGSDNMDGASGDDQGGDDTRPARKKRYHRHTPQQIQELESLFKECPHPDEQQRLELSRRLSLDTRQVKFWFQNRRTQMKTQIERHENSLLRQENDKLRAENISLREGMRNPICTNCGGPAMVGESSLELQRLRVENAHLKDQLEKMCALTGKFMGRPASSLGNPTSLELGVGGSGFGGLSSDSTPMPLGHPNLSSRNISSSLAVVPQTRLNSGSSVIDRSLETSGYLELALASMDELLKMAQTDEPLWIRNLEGGREILNYNEYLRNFSNPCNGPRPDGFVTEASRESGMVIPNSLALVETLMDSNKWAEMFPCMVSRTSTTDVISDGMGGTRNGALQLMHAELQVLSPVVPVREVNFLRFCKQHAEGVWAVVDVSIDSIRESETAPQFFSCRRKPSGCVVQDMPNGFSKVTWVEHAEYDENIVHQLYRPLISSGMGFGAQRWLANLQRQCECLAILVSSSTPSLDRRGITAIGRKSMLKLAQRMTNNFCAGVCASTVHNWNKLTTGNVGEDVRVMTRNSVNDPGEPRGIVLSAATSVWLPVSPQKLFDFLRNEQLRGEWDILSNGGPMEEMAYIAKGQGHGNCVSLLRANAMNPNQTNMLILQETCIDAAGSLVVYAPVDIPAMTVVMNGGDSAYVALLPSGFAIVPDGQISNGGSGHRAGGSLLTMAFQILVDSLPTADLTVESIDTVKNLISCTLLKIRRKLMNTN